MESLWSGKGKIWENFVEKSEASFPQCGDGEKVESGKSGIVKGETGKILSVSSELYSTMFSTNC